MSAASFSESAARAASIDASWSCRAWNRSSSLVWAPLPLSVLGPAVGRDPAVTLLVVARGAGAALVVVARVGGRASSLFGGAVVARVVRRVTLLESAGAFGTVNWVAFRTGKTRVGATLGAVLDGLSG